MRKITPGWYRLDGYAPIYEINTDGDVRVIREGKEPHVLKVRCMEWYDYRPTVRLHGADGSYNRYPVAKLMRDTFLGGARPGYVVTHRDGNTLNNALYNLTFATREQVGHRCGQYARKPVYKIHRASGEIVEVFRSAKEAGAAEHCDKSTIQNICRGVYKSSRALGDEFVFVYADRYEEHQDYLRKKARREKRDCEGAEQIG